MANEAFWQWLASSGLTPETDPAYYASGQATADEYANAIKVAFNNTSNGSAERKQLIDSLYSIGIIQGADRDYWYSNDAAALGEDFTNLQNAAKKLDLQSGGEDVGVKALPRNSQLVNVNGELRLVWDLGDGLGSAWYSISADQVKKLYGGDWQSYVSANFGTKGAFEARYGNYYWGNAAEISINADSPWEDLAQRAFEAFGYVAGIEDPEIRRLILQGHFEDWDQQEFLSHYNNTEYFKSTTELQRDWSQKTESEKQASIATKAGELVDLYRRHWGVDPVGGISSSDVRAQAEAILSGKSTQAEWEYSTRTSAAKSPDTPAARDVVNEERAQGEMAVTIENRGGFARERWEYWMGATPVPDEFVNRWGRDLYMNTASEDDLEKSLRELSAGTWATKPENIGWQEWAAPAKANIRNLLELTTVDDTDSLLSNILNNGLNGYDANLAIRKDQRFRSTNRMFDELSQSAEKLGRTFGFVA